MKDQKQNQTIDEMTEMAKMMKKKPLNQMSIEESLNFAEHIKQMRKDDMELKKKARIEIICYSKGGKWNSASYNYTETLSRNDVFDIEMKAFDLIDTLIARKLKRKSSKLPLKRRK